MRTDKEIMQIIDEAIKSIWENEIQSDYNANWIMNEDGLKNPLHFHLRKQLEPILMESNLRNLRSSKTQSFKENSIAAVKWLFENWLLIVSVLGFIVLVTAATVLIVKRFKRKNEVLISKQK